MLIHINYQIIGNLLKICGNPAGFLGNHLDLQYDYTVLSAENLILLCRQQYFHLHVFSIIVQTLSLSHYGYLEPLHPNIIKHFLYTVVSGYIPQGTDKENLFHNQKPL